MTFTALPQFLDAVVGRLRGDAPLLGRISGVYDEVPKAASGHFIVVDEPFEVRDATFGQNGHQVTLTFSIVLQSPVTSKTATGKAGFREGVSIAEDVLALLTDIEGNPLTVDDHDVVDVDVETIDCVRETDGVTRRVDVTITATLEDHQDAP